MNLTKLFEQKLRVSVIFVLFIFKFCSPNNFKCGFSDDANESIELYCDNYERTLPANCSTTFLTTVKTYNKSKVSALKVRGCDSNTFHQVVDDFQNVHLLDISYSGIETLDSFELKYDQLVKVNASYNRLSKISSEFFANLPNVTEVDFSHNELTGCIDFPDSLMYVDLSYSKIEWIHHDSNELSNRSILRTLRLEGNPLRVFDWKILPLLKTGYSLYMSWELITDFKIWNYVGKPIRVVTNSQDEGFLQTTTGIIELHCNADSFKNIKRFELIDNTIENPTEIINCLAPTIKYLTLSGKFNETIDSTSLARLVDLRELCLYDAQLSEFDFSTLKYVTQIELLDLSHNNFERVSNISFLESAKHLIHLNMAENQLECTQELIQFLSSSVSTLNLAGNYVGKLQDGSFDKLINLQHLYLVNTSLSFDNFKPFESLHKLQTLDISYNNLENCNCTSLSLTLEELRQFQAIDCRVENASELMTIFANSRSLLKLVLAGNSLRELNAEMLMDFTELQHLNLSNMNLSKLDFGILEHKPQLKLLDVSYNQLESVDFSSVLSDVNSIRLEGNNLNDIKYLTESHFPQLVYLDISKNNFSCKYLSLFIPKLEQEWLYLKIISSPSEQLCQAED